MSDLGQSTYQPMSDSVLYGQKYLPTPKSDVIYGRPQSKIKVPLKLNTYHSSWYEIAMFGLNVIAAIIPEKKQIIKQINDLSFSSSFDLLTNQTTKSTNQKHSNVTNMMKKKFCAKCQKKICSQL